MTKILQILMVGLMVVLVGLTGANTYQQWASRTSLSRRVEHLEDERESLRVKLKAMDEFCNKVLTLLEKQTWKAPSKSAP